MNIELIPYVQIENQNFSTAEVKIFKDFFEEITFREGKIVFSFVNCKFNELTIFNNENIDFKEISIGFSFCQINRIKIDEIVSDRIGINFHGCIIDGNIKNKNIKYININNCLTPMLFLQHQKKINISYTEENILVKKWIALLRQKGIESIEALIELNQSILINHPQSISISFNHNQKEKKGLYRDKYSSAPDSIIRYSLSEQQKKKLNINISIDFSSQEDNESKIENCILNSLTLKGTANGKISIENTKINNLYIHDFSSESDTLLYNITPNATESKLQIHKSNMDKSWFDNIDFNGYETLSFYRTRFAKATFTSCNFPNNNLSFAKFKILENIHYPDKKPENYYKDQYEMFLQLKTSLESSGNYHEAQKLGAISKESLRKVSTLSKWDKFILWTGSMSNNHGLSIKRPLIGLFLFSILFYIGYLCSIGRIFNSNEVDYTLIGHYFSFMDLTHRKDFLVSKEEYTFATLTIDFVNKLVVGFFLVQLVSAFRKYGKK
jgi:uncharacterized protein YjbI with pentapeptide repeats